MPALQPRPPDFVNGRAQQRASWVPVGATVSNEGSGAPHRRHLVTQTPRLERLEQGIEFHCGRAHLLLVIHKPARQVIGNGVIVFAYVRQHPQQALAIRRGGPNERTLRGGHEQRKEQAAVLLQVALDKATFSQPAQLGFKVRWQPAFDQGQA